MNVLKRIIQLRTERGWSEYQLAEAAELPQSTISSWSRQNVVPSIQNLEKICNAFQITLSQFFLEDDSQAICLTESQKSMFHAWNRLTVEQQTTLLQFMKTI